MIYSKSGEYFAYGMYYKIERTNRVKMNIGDSFLIDSRHSWPDILLCAPVCVKVSLVRPLSVFC